MSAKPRPDTLTKNDLALKIMGRLKLPGKRFSKEHLRVKLMIDAAFEAIGDQLASGGRCEFRNFGVFETRVVGGYTRKNGFGIGPKNVTVPRSRKAAFRAGLELWMKLGNPWETYRLNRALVRKRSQQGSGAPNKTS